MELSTIPEPSTYCIALAGLACGGFSMWRRRKCQYLGRSFTAAASFALAATCLAITPSHAVTIEWSTIVSSTGNTPDPLTGYGSVDREYRIGKYEVTIGQYTEFLNAVDPGGTNPYSLYNNSMGTDGNIRGILFSSGSASGQKYSPIGSPNRPITFVSWFDAARFANWMQNGQGSGSTETGAYALVGGQTSGAAPARNPGAQFYIPTENEWYKAAYYSPLLNSGSGGYYTYATQSHTAPGNTIGDGANQANYYAGDYSVTQSSSFSSSQNYLTDVGAFTNSASYYGTFDQSGNVWEWNDLTGAAGSSRGLRGGVWSSQPLNLSSSYRFPLVPSTGDDYIGFRLASPVAVPEPSTWVMGLAGIACAGWGVWRRRKRA
ncbi:MAG: SUMF1/EgtB/PvdO family nonheme iron enzyme [Planctomycetia bacterium]